MLEGKGTCSIQPPAAAALPLPGSASKEEIEDINQTVWRERKISTIWHSLALFLDYS